MSPGNATTILIHIKLNSMRQMTKLSSPNYCILPSVIIRAAESRPSYWAISQLSHRRIWQLASSVTVLSPSNVIVPLSIHRSNDEVAGVVVWLTQALVENKTQLRMQSNSPRLR